MRAGRFRPGLRARLGRVDYWQNLREASGAETLITVGAGVIVRRDREVLLQRRRDGGVWGLPGGAKELGESLEETARRELLEETGLTARTLSFVTLCSGPEFAHTYPSGDRIEHVAAIYEALRVEGEPRADGREGTALGFFDAGGLPAMQPLSRLLLRQALEVLGH